MFLLHRASLSAVVVLCLVQLLSAGPSIDDLVNDIDIPFKKYVLKNGLTLIVHEDHKAPIVARSEEHTSELQSRENLVCRLLLEKKKKKIYKKISISLSKQS